MQHGSWKPPTPSRLPARSFATSRVLNDAKRDLPPPDTVPGYDFLESENSPSSAQEELRHELENASEDIELAGAEVAQSAEPTPTPELPSITSAEDDTSESVPTSTADATPIPWYLQSQNIPERTAPSEQSAREAIPELPANPPPLLQTLLEYISITAGLDDLVLIDLRHLDPPPALGPKLIMVLGTARSEKHLHVSADRFCRYLRREHGLKANAAGLLGRNELKIKLRRKAKRMKMLANVGGRTDEEAMQNLDDGIRTGWICCTVGKIEAHPNDTEMPGADVANLENFVGFRDVKPGVNLVFQMFTEEKRTEIDLETLWGGVLRSDERKDSIAEEALRELIDDVEAGQDRVESEWEAERKAVEVELAERAERKAEVKARIEAEKEAEKAESKPSPPKEGSPAAAVLGKQWRRPSAGRGDIFPPLPSPGAARQIRRLHTVGLGLKVV